jgi:hypothetical protein
VAPEITSDTLESASDRQLLMEAVAKLREMSSLLDEFRPLLDAYRSTNGGTVGLLRGMRRGPRGG